MAIEGLDAMLPVETTAFLPQVALASEMDADRGPTLDSALARAGLDERDGRSRPERLLDRDALIPDLWLSPGFHPSRRVVVDHDEAPTPLRKLDADEMALIAGGSGSDMNGEGDSPPDATVYGWRYWDWNFPDNDPDEEYPTGTGGGPDPSPDLPHDETCGSEDGAAKQIADDIKAAPAVTGRGDWTQIEMGTFVVRTGSGRYGALESTIYTDNQTEGVTIPNVWGDDYVEGTVHNHPDLLGDDQIDLVNRYPSEGDWEAAEVLYNAHSPHYPGYDPSIWIMDKEGVLREFKFSERAAIEGLTRLQKEAGQGLEGRERTSSCS